jgi:hypothetical protein
MKSSFPASTLIAPSHLMPNGVSQEATTVWLNPARSGLQRYTSVFILAMTRNSGARIIVEKDLATVAIERGLKATRSVDLYPKGLWDESGPATKEIMWARIKAQGCDAIYTVSLLDVKSTKCYMPGPNAYAPYTQDPSYGSFGAYYASVQEIVSSPGYYTTKRTYFLEGNVFDAATGDIQWSMQSIAYDPPDLEFFGKEYARLLVDQLIRPKGLEP